jgi:hypothetical protein
LEALVSSQILNHTAALARIEQKLDAVTAMETKEMLNLDALTSAVARETSVDDSILVLVKTLADNQAALAKQLAEALANNDPAAIAAAQKAIDDSAVAMTANADRISKAVTDNTPAAV